MQKFLSIIVPHYDESEFEIFPLLSSINNQVGIDFNDIEVIVSNDGGSYKLDIEFLKLFRYRIKQIWLSKNLGPGMARQTGLDNTNSQYIMFCDADDILHNVGILGAMIQEVKRTKTDMLFTSWLEEVYDGSKYHYVTHSVENTWMHGKMIRQQFLKQNNIRFHEKLRIHEDSYFLSIASALADHRHHIDTISYVWKYRPNSITRRNNGIYTYESAPEFIKASILAFHEIEKLAPQVMEQKVIDFIVYNFFCFHQPIWDSTELSQYLDSARHQFHICMEPFWHYYYSASFETIASIYNDVRKQHYFNLIETETLDAWINKMISYQ